MFTDLVRRAVFASPWSAAQASYARRLGGFRDRLDAWLWRGRQRALERRLAGCADVADVERVLRDASYARPPSLLN